MAFTDYTFIYKDIPGNLNTATNPRFIAQHRACVAIPNEVLDKLSYDTWADLLYDINYREPLSHDDISVLLGTDLPNIHNIL